MISPPHESKRLRRFTLVGLLLLGLTAALPNAARAADDAEENDPAKKGYTLPYFFAAVNVLAVIVAVTRPAHRKFEVESLENDDED